MKVIISENRIIQLMKKYIKNNHPSLLEPFEVKHDWRSVTNEFFDIDNDLVMIEYPENRFHYVNEKYRDIYDFFGESAFEEFFSDVHNINFFSWKFTNYD